jgi:Phosphodiester glycosidase
MNRRSLGRRAVAWAVALALASTVTGTGVPIRSALAVAEPNCPSTASTKEWPNAGGAYRGVLLCSGVYQGDDFFVQILSLDQGASMRIVSHVTDGDTPGNANTKFDKHSASQWYSSIGSYNSIPGTGDLFSVTNSGFFADGDAVSTNRMSFPQKKSGTVTSLGAAFNGANGAGDWDALKRVLKLSSPPGTRQTASIAPIGPHYTYTEFNTAASPSGIAYDAVVGFAPLQGDTAESRRTYVGTSNDNKTLFIIATEDWMTLSQIVNLFGTMGVNSDHLVQLDGGGSTQMATKDGKSIISTKCWPGLCERWVPEVLAVYEGNPPSPDNGLLLGDVSFDGREDLIVRTSAGELNRYVNSGNSNAPYSNGNLIGPGWDQFNWYLVGDVNWDQYDDVVAMRFDGTLWLYTHSHNVNAPYNTGSLIGTDWLTFNHVALGNMNPEDGYADIVATKPDGTLWRYINSGNVASPYSLPSQIGNGWQTFNRIRLGDLNRDNLDEIVATKPDGTLWAYTNSASSATDPGPFGLYQPKQIGTLWYSQNRYDLGDVTGDGFDDIVSTATDGTLYLWTNGNVYPYNGYPILYSPFPNPPAYVGTGWVATGWH